MQPTTMTLAVMRLAITSIIIAVGLQYTQSTAIRLAVALGFPVFYVLFSLPWSNQTYVSVLYGQVDEQWRRLPSGTIRSRTSVVKFISMALSSFRDDRDGCDVRDVSDDDTEKDISILLRFEDSGKIAGVCFISWDMSLLSFEGLLADSIRKSCQPVELVARLINGRVVYLVATFGPLNEEQQRALLTMCQILNQAPNTKQLRPFKCRNFIQRSRKEPKMQQII